MLPFRLLLFVLFGIQEVLSSPLQVPLQLPAAIKPRKLRGRFLHISDMHPDPHYKVHAAESSACHKRKSKAKKNISGYYGTPYSECDSPLRLTNYTLDFLDKEWSSEIDFVVWTGDNARHDNDRKIPRTPGEIYDLNRAVAAKMEKVFASKGIYVIPSLGNNDVWPHNIMTPGPNSITNEFASIWKSFIPFPNLQVFQRGAYYSVEVVRDELAVISLNTMYFYDSNKAVGGCMFKEPDDAGNLQLDWLEVQLKTFRRRDMQVYIIGHVPPSTGNYFPECYVRYAELALRFQDTILGHLFGHMNADHFGFLEAIDLQLTPEDDTPRNRDGPDLCDTLLHEFGALPKETKKNELDNYAVINVSPPVVPNPYKPTFRIFSYNITELEAGVDIATRKKKGSKRKHGHRRGDHGNKASHCLHEPYRDSWKCHLNESWHSDPDSPSRHNQLWTPLGYAQYYIPDLEKADETHEPQFKLEYLTFSLERLHGMGYPIPLEQLPRSLQNSTVTESKFAPYLMEDLTIGSWVKLAQQLANPKNKKLRKRFRKYMYLGRGDEY